MKDLNSDSYERKVAKDPRVADPQIHLTQGYSVTNEQLDDATFRQVVTGRHRQVYDRDAILPRRCASGIPQPSRQSNHGDFITKTRSMQRPLHALREVTTKPWYECP